MTASPSARVSRPARSWRLARRTAIFLLLVLGGAALASAAPTWLRTSGPRRSTRTSWSRSPAPQPHRGRCGSAGRRGERAGSRLVGRIGRWVVLVVAAASGVVVAASAAAILRDPAPAARSAVAEATGVTELTGAVSLTPWPAVALAVGVLVVLAAAWTAASSPSWARVSARHEIVRPDAGAGAAPGPRPSPSRRGTAPRPVPTGRTPGVPTARRTTGPTSRRPGTR
ncbi:Trp biosynthesis-associated membrane protein [Oerskovia sp. M15]